MDKKIVVEIEYCNIVDTSDYYIASINNSEYKMSVTGKTISQCFKELAISLEVHDLHKKNK